MEKCYYGSINDIDELRKSSSGGFAASISKYAISKQGVVYGVAYTRDFKAAEFIRAASEEDIQKLLGSKYIQADNSRINSGGGLFADIKSGIMTVLIGLPCNIASVISELKKQGIKHDNLITIDLVCGGVTFTEVAKQYVEYLERKNKSTIIDLSVRYKNPDWTPPYFRAVFANGKVFCRKFYETEYGYAFENMKKENCYACRFKGKNHFSDITLGDAWGIKKDDIGYNPCGVSVAFVHTQTGDSLLKELEDIDLYEKDPDQMKRSNPRYLSPKPKLEKNERFRTNFQKYGLNKACRKAYGLKKRMINSMPVGMIKLLRLIKHNTEKQKQ